MTCPSDLIETQYVMDKKSLVTYEQHEFHVGVNRIMLKMDKLERVTSSGIIIPLTAEKEVDYRGTIVATSKGTKQTFPLGHTAIVPRRKGFVVPTDDKENEYRIYSIRDIKYVQ